MCPKAVLKRPKIMADGSRVWLTNSGVIAYADLISILYDLNKLLPNQFDVDDLVQQLDEIAEGHTLKLSPNDRGGA